jgi:hypothetical protein
MSRASTLAALVLMLVPGVAAAQAPIAIQPLPAAPPPAAPPPVIVVAPPVAAPPIANPADGPGECVTTTTTTTRCTGAAAPLAAHPAPPPVIVVPPPPGRDDAPPLWPCPVVIPPGWHLQQDPDGSWWRVRKHRGQPGLWVPGLVLWLSSYATGTFAGVGTGQPEAALPIAGAFVAAGFSEGTSAQVGWAVDGLVQLGSFVMFVVGASLDGKLERLPVSVTPAAFYGGGQGVALTGRF